MRLAVVSLMIIVASAPAQTVLHVDDDAPPGGDGLSWATAFHYLQDGLAAAQPGSGVTEVRVAQGLYKPDEGADQVPDNRHARFGMPLGVAIRGGYAGLGAPDPDARDLAAYATTLRGDLWGNDTDPFNLRGDNAYHVVMALWVDDTSVLDGFVIYGGACNLPVEESLGGGGIYIQGGSPTIVNCTFDRNTAGSGGAALALDSAPTFLDCLFTGNNQAGCYGSGSSIYAAQSSPTVIGCTFTAADVSGCTGSHGGAVYLDLCQDTVIDGCLVTGNSGPWSGLFYDGDGTVSVTNCVFVDNYVDDGGAILLAGSVGDISDCVFLDNSGGGGSGLRLFPELATVTDCVFIGNTGGGAYCGGMTGESVFVDCLFADNSAAVNGGAVGNSGTLTLVNCEFTGNTAGSRGGAVGGFGDTTVIGCTFRDNETPGQGGAIFDNEILSIANCVIHDNTAGTNGGGVYAESHMSAVNCTIAGNRAQDGGGLVALAWDAGVDNCILWGNTDDVHGTTEAAQLQHAGSVDFSCVQGWTGGLGGLANFGADPMFVDLEAGMLRLVPGSPCIDTGNNLAVPAGLDTDLEGNDRIMDGDGNGSVIVDRGAIEYLFRDCNTNGVDDGLEIYEGAHPDCNANGAPDACDLADGTSTDVDGNGVPDDCQDCNDNGVFDPDDLAGGSSLDCNGNLLPDECDIADGTSLDCNANVIPDECETDCNGNSVPDDCDLAHGTSTDCNGNAVPDDCDIQQGTSLDYNQNGIPDECEGDCNDNGIPDFMDIALGHSGDCNGNDVPDECDIAMGVSLDCNGNGVPDDCDLLSGAAPDCNDNGVPDSCDIADGTSPDLDENGVPDECDPDCNGNGSPDVLDLLYGESYDCNRNFVPDECDIWDGVSEDCNENLVPDDCEARIDYHAESGQLSPVGGEAPLTFTLLTPPLASTDVLMSFTAIGDLGSPNEHLDVYMNGSYVGSAYAGSFSNCPSTPDIDAEILDMSLYNLAVAAGADVVFELFASPYVDPDECTQSYITMAVEYTWFGTNDANGDGVPDDCECPGDGNEDGTVDIVDFLNLLADWGETDSPYDVAPDGGDGFVGIEDFLFMLAVWGPCP
jgi:hypothetical protein